MNFHNPPTRLETDQWQDETEKSKTKVFNNVLLFIDSLGVLIITVISAFHLQVWERPDMDFINFLSFYSHL